MSTPAYVDSETITQANRAQSSRVPVPLPNDPYVAFRHAKLVDTYIESDLEEAPSEAEESGTFKLILDTDSEEDELGENDTKENESLDVDDERESARRHALESTEEIAPSTYEVGQSFRFVPEQEGAERIFAFRQPTLVTWVDPEDVRVYTDIPTYAP
nr:hypothetical protein [Tanacetum cinerariifolium]